MKIKIPEIKEKNKGWNPYVAGIWLGLLTIVSVYLTTISTYANQTRENVIKRGSLNCGVSQGVPGFSNADASGKWAGIDVDFCRAVAAAILGDANKVKFTPTSNRDRFEILKNKEIDILARNTTWYFIRDVAFGIRFVEPIYYDGQSFIVKKSSKITSVKQLNNSTVCVVQGTGTEINLRDYFKNNNIKYNVLTFSDVDSNLSAYDSGRCDAYTNDRSQLFGLKQKLKKPDDHVVLSDIISKEPLGPFISINDKNFEDIVRWTLYVMLESEEQGLSSKNIDSFKNSDNPIILRLLNIGANTNVPLNLSNDWSYNIIKQVGNYEEIFERNLGSESTIKLDRGINKLWNKGGIMYSPPLK